MENTLVWGEWREGGLHRPSLSHPPPALAVLREDSNSSDGPPSPSPIVTYTPHHPLQIKASEDLNKSPTAYKTSERFQTNSNSFNVSSNSNGVDSNISSNSLGPKITHNSHKDPAFPPNSVEFRSPTNINRLDAISPNVNDSFNEKAIVEVQSVSKNVLEVNHSKN